jgi:hypothetical protein
VIRAPRAARHAFFTRAPRARPRRIGYRRARAFRAFHGTSMSTHRILLVLALGLSLGACASAGGNRLQGSSTVADAGKVAAVDRWAQRRGATVVWLNYPTRTAARAR